MNPRLPLLLSVFLLTLPAIVGAKEVVLQKGEIYRDHDLTVTCDGGHAGPLSQAVAVRECQYWDNFDKKCLFEKTVYTYNGVECTEECQHWDAFNKTCDYQSKCTFYPRQETFVLSTCDEFDNYSHKCLRIKQEKIDAGR